MTEAKKGKESLWTPEQKRRIRELPKPSKIRAPNKARRLENGIVEVKLTNDVVMYTDAADWYGWLQRYRWRAKNLHSQWVACTDVPTVNGRITVYYHRMVAFKYALIKDLHEDIIVDHIAHKNVEDMIIDNRKENLRLATQQENSQNRRKINNSSSQYKGVYWNQSAGKWRAEITIDGKPKHLGYFEEEEVAAQAYDNAARKSQGEWARLNFETEEDREAKTTFKKETKGRNKKKKTKTKKKGSK